MSNLFANVSPEVLAHPIYQSGDTYKPGMIVAGSDGNLYIAATAGLLVDPVTANISTGGWGLFACMTNTTIGIPARGATLAQIQAYIKLARVVPGVALTFTLADATYTGGTEMTMLGHADGQRITLQGTTKAGTIVNLGANSIDGDGTLVNINTATINGTAALVNTGASATFTSVDFNTSASGLYSVVGGSGAQLVLDACTVTCTSNSNAVAAFDGGSVKIRTSFTAAGPVGGTGDGGLTTAAGGSITCTCPVTIHGFRAGLYATRSGVIDTIGNVATVTDCTAAAVESTDQGSVTFAGTLNPGTGACISCAGGAVAANGAVTLTRTGGSAQLIFSDQGGQVNLKNGATMSATNTTGDVIAATNASNITVNGGTLTVSRAGITTGNGVRASVGSSVRLTGFGNTSLVGGETGVLGSVNSGVRIDGSGTLGISGQASRLVLSQYGSNVNFVMGASTYSSSAGASAVLANKNSAVFFESTSQTFTSSGVGLSSSDGSTVLAVTGTRTLSNVTGGVTASFNSTISILGIAFSGTNGALTADRQGSIFCYGYTGTLPAVAPGNGGVVQSV
jgi:hypothetical protein